MTVLEAAGAGAPIVATNTALAARELAEEGAVILVDPMAKSIAAGILQGLSEEGRRAGEKAAPLVGERFGWPSVSQRLLDQLVTL
jgi:glycosyltransferase involved in cell wall biosynthesis